MWLSYGHLNENIIRLSDKKREKIANILWMVAKSCTSWCMACPLMIPLFNYLPCFMGTGSPFSDRPSGASAALCLFIAGGGHK